MGAVLGFTAILERTVCHTPNTAPIVTIGRTVTIRDTRIREADTGPTSIITETERSRPRPPTWRASAHRADAGAGDPIANARTAGYLGIREAGGGRGKRPVYALTRRPA